MDERYIDVSYDEDNGLKLTDALKAVFRALPICLLAGAVFAGVFLAYTLLCMEPQYRASFTAYISNRPTFEETSEKTSEETLAEETINVINIGDVQASYALAKTYAFVFESREMALSAVRYADLSSYEERAKRQGLISTSTEQDTPLVTVTATADSPEDAYKISEAVLALIPDRIAQIPDGSSMTVVEPPQIPTKPSSPKKKLNAAIGFVLGFGLSALVAIVRDQRDKLIWDKNEIEARYGTPAFVDIQDVLPLLPRHAARLVGITDAHDGSLAAADAIALAESYAARGAHVLLVDGDTENATCRKLLGASRAAGLSDILAGNAVASDMVQHLVGKGMDFIASGKHTSDFALKVGSTQMESLLDTLEREYDCVIVAISSAISNSGALMLADRADRTFLSVREGSTRKPDVEKALRMLKLADVRIDGFMYSKPRNRAGRLTVRHG